MTVTPITCGRYFLSRIPGVVGHFGVEEELAAVFISPEMIDESWGVAEKALPTLLRSILSQLESTALQQSLEDMSGDGFYLSLLPSASYVDSRAVKSCIWLNEAAEPVSLSILDESVYAFRDRVASSQNASLSVRAVIATQNWCSAGEAVNVGTCQALPTYNEIGLMESIEIFGSNHYDMSTLFVSGESATCKLGRLHLRSHTEQSATIAFTDDRSHITHTGEACDVYIYTERAGDVIAIAVETNMSEL